MYYPLRRKSECLPLRRKHFKKIMDWTTKRYNDQVLAFTKTKKKKKKKKQQKKKKKKKKKKTKIYKVKYNSQYQVVQK